MKKLVLLCASLCAMVLLISASPARAQVLFVANGGLDSNPCTSTSPCASFQAAINQGATEIYCLDSGSFGKFNITTSIIVDCKGNVGNVGVINGSAITINANLSEYTIVLRNLNISGRGASLYGITTTSFSKGTVIVEDCMIYGFVGGYGIYFAPSSGRGLLQVSNSQIFGNTHGIVVSPSGGQIASVTLDHVEMVANSNAGLVLTTLSSGVVAGTMRNSVAGSNGLYGVFSDATQAFFTIEGSSIVANLTYGITTHSAGSNLNVTASIISSNGTGVKATSGNIISFANNTLNGNGSDGTFTSTKALK